MQVLNIVIRIPTNEILVAVPLSPLYALHYLMSILRGPIVLTTLEGLQIGVLMLVNLRQLVAQARSNGINGVFHKLIIFGTPPFVTVIDFFTSLFFAAQNRRAS